MDPPLWIVFELVFVGRLLVSEIPPTVPQVRENPDPS